MLSLFDLLVKEVFPPQKESYDLSRERQNFKHALCSHPHKESPRSVKCHSPPSHPKKQTWRLSDFAWLDHYWQMEEDKAKAIESLLRDGVHLRSLMEVTDRGAGDERWNLLDAAIAGCQFQTAELLFANGIRSQLGSALGTYLVRLHEVSSTGGITEILFKVDLASVEAAAKCGIDIRRVRVDLGNCLTSFLKAGISYRHVDKSMLVNWTLLDVAVRAGQVRESNWLASRMCTHRFGCEPGMDLSAFRAYDDWGYGYVISRHNLFAAATSSSLLCCRKHHALSLMQLTLWIDRRHGRVRKTHADLFGRILEFVIYVPMSGLEYDETLME